MTVLNAILYTLGGVILLYCLVWLILRWKLRVYIERFKRVKTIPGFLPLPIGHGLLATGKNNQELFELIDVIFRQHCGQPIKIWAGPIPMIVIANPYDANAVLNSPQALKKHYMYKFLRNKTGLVTAPVKLWRHSRKMLNPTFNYKMLQSFIPIFNECSAKLVLNMQNNSNGVLFDCSDEIFHGLLSISCLTTLGFDLNLQQYEYGDIARLLTNITGLILNRAAKIWLYPECIYKLTKNGKEFDRLFERFHHITSDIMRCKQAEYNAMTQDEKSVVFDEDNKKIPKIFLTQIFHMAQENNLSDEYIRDQVDTMIIAGSETSAGTVSFTTLVLAMYPDIQQRVYEEIVKVTNGSDYIDNEMISKLTYTDMVIKETLRLYPAGPILGRVTTGEIEISNCTLPKHTNVIISVYHMHRDQIIWGPDAEIFNPDNFLPEKISERHPSAFIPFSYGPRSCIAMRYAFMSMKVMICYMLKNYKFTTPLKPTDLKFDLSLTLKLVNGFMVEMTPRHN